jgi:PleD family two-component response regulator
MASRPGPPMQNRSSPRVRRTFDTRRDALASRLRGMWRPGIAAEPNVWVSQEARDTGVLPQRLRVLVVDHDTRAADSLERLLHATGYPETRVAYTARGAVVFVHEFRPEVVLMDIDMPDFDESALNRTLRERAQLRHMCLVAIGGPPEHHGQIERSAASSRRLFKPIGARDLSACLLSAAAAVR